MIVVSEEQKAKIWIGINLRTFIKISRLQKDMRLQICASLAEVSEEVEQRKFQRKERKETEAAEKTRGKADLDAKEAANK